MSGGIGCVTSKYLPCKNDNKGTPRIVLALPASSLVPPTDTVVKWSDLVENTTDVPVYDLNTGIITVPTAGVWEVSITVTVDQSGSLGIPSLFYQHVLSVNKSKSSDGYTFRLVDVYQKRWSSNVEVVHQLILKGSDSMRLDTGVRLTVNVSTFNFEGGTIALTTRIGGGACLTCMTLVKVGE